MDEIVDEVIDAAAELDAAADMFVAATERLQALCKKYQRPKAALGGDWGHVKYLRQLNPTLRYAETVEELQTESKATVHEVLAQRRAIDARIETLRALGIDGLANRVKTVSKRGNQAVNSLVGKLWRESERLEKASKAIAFVPLPKGRCAIHSLPDEIIAIILGMAATPLSDDRGDEPIRFRLVCRRWHGIIQNYLRNQYADARWLTTGACGPERPIQDLPPGVHLARKYVVPRTGLDTKYVRGMWIQNVLCAEGPNYIRTKNAVPYYRGHALPIENPTQARIAGNHFVTVVPHAHADTVALWTFEFDRPPRMAWSAPIEGVVAVELFDDGTVIVGSPLEVVAYRDGRVAWKSKPINRIVHMDLKMAVDRKRGRILAVNDLRYWRVYAKATGKILLSGGKEGGPANYYSDKKNNECLDVAINDRTGMMFWLARHKVVWMNLKQKSKTICASDVLKSMTVAPNDLVYLTDDKARFWTL